jgi:hypothetical protein
LRLGGYADVLTRRISTENPEVPRHGSSGFFTTGGRRAAEPQPKSSDPINARGAKGAKGTRTPIQTAVLSRRDAETRRSFRWAMRRDASAFPPCGSSRFSTVSIPNSIRFSQRTQRAQRSLGDSPGGSICVHLRHLRLKIRNFHGVENVFSNRRNRTKGVAAFPGGGRT